MNTSNLQNLNFDFDFYAFLAGLIDSDGYIGSKALSISFHERDANVAYSLKKTLMCGTVRAIKNKKAFSFDVYALKDREFILNKVGCFLQLQHRIDALNKHYGYLKTNPTKICVLKESRWLAGFIQGDGSFQIKLTPRKSKTPLRVHVVIQIDAKSDDILNKIKKTYGGSVSYRANQNTYSYTSGSFKNAYMFRNYLDKFQVSHNNFKLYTIWREALEVVNAKQHRSALGLEKLELLKQHLSRSKKNVLKLVELTA